MRRKIRTEPAPLMGQKWRATHQATIDSILGAKVRRVTSRGSQFYNKDNWTARTFGACLCEWAELNPGMIPTRYDVEGWVAKANRVTVWGHQKQIVIAQTPDELPKWLAFALVGGGYHEAWHTKYSRLAPITIEEVWPKVERLFRLIPYEPQKGKPGWKGLTGALLTWSNIVEDIRIERVGCQEFPGTPQKMEALQDLILKQEREGREAAEHRGLPTDGAQAVVMGTFRDLGLGYQTPSQKEALRGYEERNPKAWLFVTEGPLRPFLDRAIALGGEDDLESLWLAMEIVAAIAEASEPPPPTPEAPEAPELEDEAGDEEGDGGESSPEELEDGEEVDDLSDMAIDGPEGEGEEADEEAPRMASDSQQEGQGGMGQGGDSPIVWKVGDRAVLSEGPHKGETVEVVRAGLPDEKGVQDLEFKIVEPWWKQLQGLAGELGTALEEMI